MTLIPPCVDLTLRNSCHSQEYCKSWSQREPAHAETKHQDNSTKTTVHARAQYQRFPPRFRSVGHFCQLWFRYLSSPTGREGEISRPVDHMRQIPYILSPRLIVSTSFYIYRTIFYIFSPCGTLRYVLMQSIVNNCGRALARTLISRLRPLLSFCQFSYGAIIRL